MAITRWADADFFLMGATDLETLMEGVNGAMLVCSGANNPADRTAAVAAALATKASPAVTLSGADGADQVATFAANAAVPVDVSGTATSVCLIDNTRLLWVQPCTAQALVDTGTVDIPEWAITLHQPSAP
jgi:hypothetical protein